MLLMMLIAQLATDPASAPAGSSDQDRITTTEVFDYAEWRTCALKETHRKARTVADHEKAADLAMSACQTKEDEYRASLDALAKLYKLADPADFARRNGDQTHTALRDMMIKEMK